MMAMADTAGVESHRKQYVVFAGMLFTPWRALVGLQTIGKQYNEARGFVVKRLSDDRFS